MSAFLEHVRATFWTKNGGAEELCGLVSPVTVLASIVPRASSSPIAGGCFGLVWPASTHILSDYCAACDQLRVRREVRQHHHGRIVLGNCPSADARPSHVRCGRRFLRSGWPYVVCTVMSLKRRPARPHGTNLSCMYLLSACLVTNLRI